MAKRVETKAKRERDGWRVYSDKPKFFGLEAGTDDATWIYASHEHGKIVLDMCGGIDLPPARAAQFAAKVAAIAAKAAKEAKDGR